MRADKKVIPRDKFIGKPGMDALGFPFTRKPKFKVGQRYEIFGTTYVYVRETSSSVSGVY